MKDRIKEPSTWAGIAAIFQVLKVFLPQHTVFADALTAGAGAIAMALPEKGKAIETK
ncbi:MAG TPA: hypothetical protein VEC35_23445 [Noviherbaspirillum sp.]|nr:hypothetical protein [Noviherbaspirillum sp.]